MMMSVLGFFSDILPNFTACQNWGYRCSQGSLQVISWDPLSNLLPWSFSPWSYHLSGGSQHWTYRPGRWSSSSRSGWWELESWSYCLNVAHLFRTLRQPMGPREVWVKWRIQLNDTWRAEEGPQNLSLADCLHFHMNKFLAPLCSYVGLVKTHNTAREGIRNNFCHAFVLNCGLMGQG